MQKAIERAVRERAGGRCEYCALPESFLRIPFWMDHIRARQHHDATELSNLALACPFCNRFKGPNLSGVDPADAAIVPLFNPRVDRWEKHCALRGSRIVGLTPSDRATVEVLQMNGVVQVTLREACLREGLMS